MSHYDLEEELNRIKLEFDQKFGGGSDMNFDELPDDLESMLGQYGYATLPKNQQQQYQEDPQNDDYDDLLNQLDREYKEQQQQQIYENQQYENEDYNQDYDPNQQYFEQYVEDGDYQYDNYDQYAGQYGNDDDYQEIEVEFDEFGGQMQQDHDAEFDDALPPLEDMLLLITNPKIHEKYNYVLPKRGQQTLLRIKEQQKPQIQPIIQPSIVQPKIQQQVYQPRASKSGSYFPQLNQAAWSVPDCDLVVQHLKSLLMNVLQDALVVKRLDLQNAANSTQAETLFRNSGNQLKEIRELIATISRIDTQDSYHNAIQQEIEKLSDVMIKSTVVMLRTAMNVTKRTASVDQFTNAYNPFLSDAKSLIGKVNNLQFGCWGPNEVFFAM